MGATEGQRRMQQGKEAEYRRAVRDRQTSRNQAQPQPGMPAPPRRGIERARAEVIREIQVAGNTRRRNTQAGGSGGY